MTRDEIEALAAYAQCAQFGTVSVYPWTMRELCRLALIGHAIDKREREIAAGLDKISADATPVPASPPSASPAE